MSNSTVNSFDLLGKIVPELLSLTIVGLFLCYVLIVAFRYLLAAFVIAGKDVSENLLFKTKIFEFIASLILLTADFLSGSHLKDPLVQILQTVVYYTIFADLLILSVSLLVFYIRACIGRTEGSLFVHKFLIDFYLFSAKFFISRTFPNPTFLYLPMIFLILYIFYAKFVDKREIWAVLSRC